MQKKKGFVSISKKRIKTTMMIKKFFMIFAIFAFTACAFAESWKDAYLVKTQADYDALTINKTVAMDVLYIKSKNPKSWEELKTVYYGMKEHHVYLLSLVVYCPEFKEFSADVAKDSAYLKDHFDNLVLFGYSKQMFGADGISLSNEQFLSMCISISKNARKYAENKNTKNMKSICDKLKKAITAIADSEEMKDDEKKAVLKKMRLILFPAIANDDVKDVVTKLELTLKAID